MQNDLDSTRTQIKDVFIRNATIAVLDTLNRRIKIDQVVEGVSTLHTVPFFYNFGNDENFMRDFFANIPHECVIPDHAEGNYEVWPKGTILLNTIAAKPAEITNKFVRATYRKAFEVANGERSYKAMSAYLFPLPMQFTFSAQVHAKTLNQAFKITDSIFEEFYKQNVAYFQFQGNRIPGQFQIDDGVTNEKKVEFTYNDDKSVTTKFNIQFETVRPIFDTSTEMDKAHRIRQFTESITETSVASIKETILVPKEKA